MSLIPSFICILISLSFATLSFATPLKLENGRYRCHVKTWLKDSLTPQVSKQNFVAPFDAKKLTTVVETIKSYDDLGEASEGQNFLIYAQNGQTLAGLSVVDRAYRGQELEKRLNSATIGIVITDCERE